MVLNIRTERGIKPATYRCPACGQQHSEGQPRVSVRATVLAAGRFGLGTKTEVKRLERLWKQHRMREGLDLYGRPQIAEEAVSGDTAEPHGCTGRAAPAGEP
jgi:hypothetical protein